MFIKSYLNTSIEMIKAKNDLERLSFMPQKIESGEVIDFKGNISFKGLDVKDVEVFPAARVNDATRCTSALTRDYFLALDKVMPLFGNGPAETKQEDDKEYGADILALVEAGDRKGLRSLLKDYKKGKWSSLDEDKLEDDIDDLVDCAVDKAVDDARSIIKDIAFMDLDDVEPTEMTTTTPTTPADTEKKESTHKPANEDEAELIADIEGAVSDEDWEDVELLLKELGDKHPRYTEFASKLPSEQDDTKEESKSEGSVIDEILDDLDDALTEKDTTACKEILAELLVETATDDIDYVEYKAKVDALAEPARRTRRERG